jgi:hypothetical protein
MRIAIACGLVFGAVVLPPPSSVVEFEGKKVLALGIA